MIYRTIRDRDNPYFQMNRCAIDDDRLSFKAVGILAYLLSKPDGWETREQDLANRHTDGLRAVRSGIAELRQYGYMAKVQIRDGNRISGWRTEVYETPQLNPHHQTNRTVVVDETLDVQNEDVQNEDVQNGRHSNKGSLVSNELLERSSSSSGSQEAELPPLANPAEHSRLCNLMQDNGFGFVTEILRSDLDEAMEQYPPAEIEAAIKIAVRKGKPFWAYVVGILRRGVNSKPPQHNGAINGTSEPELSDEEHYARSLAYYGGRIKAA